MQSFFQHARKDFTTDEMLDFFKDEKMEFEPGEKFHYNNSGYFLLGVIIEKITGKTYADFIEQEIFAKLGMENSYYDSYPRIIKNRAVGYKMSPVGLQNADYLSTTIPYAAGSLISNVGDLFKWNQAVIGHKLISKESLEKAWTAYKLNNGETTGYGYGWSIDKLQGTRQIQHGGGIFGFLTSALYLPEEDVFVAIFSNCNCQGPSNATTRMAAVAMGKSFEYEPIEVSTDKLKKYEGVYQIKEGDKRTIVLKGDRLVAKRNNSRVFNLTPVGKDEFIFEGTLTRLKFKKKKGISITSDGEETISIKTDEKPNLEENSKDVKVSTEILKQYTGVYEVRPGMDMTISVEDGQLMGQPSGQGKVKLYARSETVFYPKEVPASVEFIKSEGKISKLIFTQGDVVFEAKKVK